ncbi:MAG: ComEC/Rec2 family competence protein [Candidatus Saccharibacteria bacterium]|nr:ComEC/Rec2 family competence protein [Candidatus Saccharibacteria bacterium]
MKGVLNKRIHVSWHIAATAAGILAGTLAARYVPAAAFADYSWLVIAAALIFITLLKRRLAFIALIILAGMFLGLYRGSVQTRELARYEPFYESQVTLRAQVVDDTTSGPGGDQRLLLGDVSLENRPMPGEIWASVPTNAEIKRGDKVTISGYLSEGFGTFAGSIFRARLVAVERPVPGDVARRVRDGFAEKVRLSVPEPEASLGISYVSGHRKALPEDLSETFRLLGLSHLVVASGFHLTIIIRFARRFFSGRSKYLATLLCFLAIGGFLLITGFSTSMTRAALVTGLSLIAWYYGRVIHPVTLLLFVAAVTVLLSPSYIWGDVGWFLSFSAFSGVIIMSPLLQKYFWGKKRSGYFRDLIVATTAAQIATFPVIAAAFGTYSPLALFANVFMLPLVPFAMLFTVTGGLAGLVVPGLAGVFGLPALIILRYMTTLTDWLAAIPWAQGEIQFSALHVGVSYIVMLAALAYMWRKTGHDFREETPI